MEFSDADIATTELVFELCFKPLLRRLRLRSIKSKNSEGDGDEVLAFMGLCYMIRVDFNSGALRELVLN